MSMVKCTNCQWVGNDSELRIMKEDLTDYESLHTRVCPNCKTDAHLEDDSHHPDCPAVDGFGCHCDGENLEQDYIDMMKKNNDGKE